jgi:hypothetical protein
VGTGEKKGGLSENVRVFSEKFKRNKICITITLCCLLYKILYSWLKKKREMKFDLM